MENYRKSIPMYLIDDVNGWYWGNLLTDWDTDFRGSGRAAVKSDKDARRKFISVLDTFPTIAKREINEQTDGKLTFEAEFTLISGEGYFFSFNNKTDEAFKMEYRGGYFVAGDQKMFKASLGLHWTRLVLDIDNGVVDYYLDGKYYGKCAFTGNAKSITVFRTGFEKEDIGEATLEHNVKLYRNYLFVDKGALYNEHPVSEDYEFTFTGKASLKYIDYFNTDHIWKDFTLKANVYQLKAGAGSSSKIVRRFDRASGNVVLETKYYLPGKNSKITVSACCGDTKVVSVFDEYTALCCSGGTLRTHSPNVWQTLRIEANTYDKTALIWLNGKKTSTIAFENNADFIDNLLIEFEANKASELMFIDLAAYIKPPYPADYVPEPVIPKKKGDYYVGMNICSIWRTGTHRGWGCISPFEENKPLLGFYDEGVAETSDWEIKWMAEHGIDFQLYCWYPSNPGRDNKPFIRNSCPGAIYQGHMSARYSDKVKLALLFEANGTTELSKETFRNVYVPSWIDYFFSDPRYMSIDNKAIMSIYAPKKLMGCFGSPEEFVVEMNYLRNEVKKLGYDDLIIMACGQNEPIYKQYGIDAVHAYNWGFLGAGVDFTKDRIKSSSELEGGTHVVPTVSSGFNCVAWHGVRHDQMTAAGMEDCLTWFRDDVLTKYDKDSWKSKLVMLSTWNEYGEGTYMCPSGLNGFGYLDAVRNVFMEDTPHVDVVPNEEQKKRICGLYPMDRRMLASLDKERSIPEYNVVKRYEFKTQKDLEKWEFHKVAKYEIKDGVLCGETCEKGPYMILKDKDFLPFEADKVVRIRINIRTRNQEGKICCVCVGFANNPELEYHNSSFYAASEPDRIAPLEYKVFNVNRMPWQNNIHGIKIFPVFAAGKFDLESIEFLDYKPEYKVIVDGERADMVLFPEYDSKNNAYIAFDPLGQLIEKANLFYEWVDTEQKLVVKAQNDYEFFKGSDTFTKDGKEYKMARALKFTDGIPMLPVEIMAEILGKKLEIKNGTIIFG